MIGQRIERSGSTARDLPRKAYKPKVQSDRDGHLNAYICGKRRPPALEFGAVILEWARVKASVEVREDRESRIRGQLKLLRTIRGNVLCFLARPYSDARCSVAWMRVPCVVLLRPNRLVGPLGLGFWDPGRGRLREPCSRVPSGRGALGAACPDCPAPRAVDGAAAGVVGARTWLAFWSFLFSPYLLPGRGSNDSDRSMHTPDPTPIPETIEKGQMIDDLHT